ncbi:hypothetical protein CXZ10_19970 [Pleomorphomonas diazotrophica]|uniref:Hemerythrin-like domain-containing protein n=1 Tax=Pleomorphomonas diazotrophica TaxID=1166257 RepID=A0A1I4V9R0_9HYPH|nr:hypothetical protein [Pleomorphomonas diazotrophica]PKR87329.1 hypothetical protein CXZ10_19970 [Pleomorphomonas diazotrophica]SFM97915.1 hypothetical protein SAMN05192571_110188 [Pleomorphomonas diazotrophica]
MSHADLLNRIPALDGRYDLYGNIHKGLRRTQCLLLSRLGANDFGDAATTEKLIGDLRRLLAMAAAHVRHEDTEIHAALNRRGIATDLLDEQHEDHHAAFRILESRIDAVETAAASDRAEAGRALYLAFAAYVADDFAHMHEEETVTAPLLWQHFSDEELLAIEMRIVSALPPEENMAFTRMMLPAMNPAQRAMMVGGMREGLPPEVFAAVVEFAVRPSLTEADFQALSSSVGLAA